MSPNRLPSLRRELVRLTTVVAFCWLVVLGFTVTWAVRHEVDDLLDEALREAAEVMYGVLTTAPELAENSAALPEVLPAPAHEEKFVWQIVDGRGQVVRRSHKAPPQALSDVTRRGLFDQSGQWRVYGIPMTGPLPRMLYVAQVARERNEARYEAVGTVLLAALTVSLLWVLLLRQRVDRGLRPLAQLARQIESYDPLEASTEPEPGDRAETEAISEAVRTLGRSLAQKVRAERAFSACAAHSLRTPLAGMDAQLALAQREPPEAQPGRLERVRAALTRLTRVVQSLLALFRAGEHWALDLRPCRLTELLAEIPVEGLTVTVEDDVEFLADPDLTTIALVNLLDNAVRFGARHVRVHGGRDSSRVCIRVQDDGHGITQERWIAVTRALQLPESSADVGLGLRLASMVAQAHGGCLILPAPVHDQLGFLVEVWFAAVPTNATERVPLRVG
ncbi:sensor histidine kinase [Roseateles sp. BYS87W]|uniref:histidine kinase n=1 Tax=Pelomonas baiyunensis TaxID=3299026 RepID=A0ABW7H1S4_9BURK